MEASQDIRTMHPRELIRGVMRGDAANFKIGYGAENAVRAVLTAHPDANRDELLAYAEGFAAGLHEAKDSPDRVAPAKMGSD